jgi:hypothetical protein
MVIAQEMLNGYLILILCFALHKLVSEIKIGEDYRHDYYRLDYMGMSKVVAEVGDYNSKTCYPGMVVVGLQIFGRLILNILVDYQTDSMLAARVTLTVVMVISCCCMSVIRNVRDLKTISSYDKVMLGDALVAVIRSQVEKRHELAALTETLVVRMLSKMVMRKEVNY